MTIVVNKQDLMRLLQGTSVPYELWDNMPSDLGKVEGGGWTDPEWKWEWIEKPYLKYSEEELYALYKEISSGELTTWKRNTTYEYPKNFAELSDALNKQQEQLHNAKAENINQLLNNQE